MPTTSPIAFLAFVAEHVELLVAVLDAGGVGQADLYALVNRFRKDQHPSPEHIVRRLSEYQVLRPAAYADTALELAPPLEELLRWLLNRQRLEGAGVLQGYFVELGALHVELRESVETGDHSAAALALKDADATMERLRELSASNREAIVAAAQALRSAGAVSAVDRFKTVLRLWERYFEPLKLLVETDGEMERCTRGLHDAIILGEARFASHV